MTTADYTIAPDYTNISTLELQELCIKGASGAVIKVYLAINLFAYGAKRTAFPSLSTISKACGNVLNKRTITRAIDWLVENGFLEKGSPRTRTRFTLLRKGLVAIKKAVTSDKPSESKATSKKVGQNRSKVGQTANQIRKKKNRNDYKARFQRPVKKSPKTPLETLSEVVKALVSGEGTFSELDNDTKALVLKDYEKGFESGGLVNWSLWGIVL